MESALDMRGALAALAWQIDLGATEAIGDAPVNRFELPKTQAKRAGAAAAAGAATGASDAGRGPGGDLGSGPGGGPGGTPEAGRSPGYSAGGGPGGMLDAGPDPVDVARHAAGAATTLEALRAAMAGYAHCDLRLGARNLVFADGNPAARVMVIGEAPGREEDLQGRPFIGRAGQLLDRMLAAIGLSRDAEDPARAVYITNVIPWRPPRNRDPEPAEIHMMLPFVQKHVDLADPDVLILMGNISVQAGLGVRGILKLRGKWTEAYGRPALPMTHPAYLLRQPQAKREAWADLLSVRARLEADR